MLTTKDTLPDWTFVGGETQEYEFTLRSENGGYYDIPDAMAFLAVAEFTNPSNIVLRKEAPIASNGTYSCLVVFALDPVDTVNLYGKHIYQITIRTAEGTVTVPQRGRMYIVENIDKDSIRVQE